MKSRYLAFALAVLGLAPRVVSAQPGVGDGERAPTDTGPTILRSRPLGLPVILASVERHHPKVDAANRKAEAAEGSLLSTEGAFDPKLKLSGKGLPLGYYTKGQLQALLTQQTPLWGSQFYAGWRRHFGDVPSYDGQLETLSAGEFTAGVHVPLWRDGAIDRSRADIQQAELEVGATKQRAAATILMTQNDAAQAYWKWVETGLTKDVQRGLLTVAEERNDRLLRQIEAGAVEPIQQIDNQRAILDRQTKLINARQKLQQAALKLSLYHRDDQGQPIVASEGEVPDAFPSPVLPNDGQLERDIRNALDQRPDLRALEAAVEQARVEVEIQDNTVAPRVDLHTWVSKDFGDGFGDVDPATLSPLDVGVGLSVEIPLLLRKERGKLQAAEGKLAAARADARLARDQIAAQIRGAYAALVAAHETADLARRAREANERLAAAERRRYELGDSDLLYVNLRELYAAESAIKELKALSAYQQALADYRTMAMLPIR